MEFLTDPCRTGKLKWALPLQQFSPTPSSLTRAFGVGMLF
jgi:hypothetical protein